MLLDFYFCSADNKYMPSLPQKTLDVITSIQDIGVEPILFGSQGVSLYIGSFKKFGDIDLLVDTKWIGGSWQTLIGEMSKLGLSLSDEHEHEFTNDEGTVVAFADVNILVRDGIAKSVDDAIQTLEVDGVKIRTLKPEVFLKNYEFSALDGYRRNTRKKKDDEVIKLISDYLQYDSRPTS